MASKGASALTGAGTGAAVGSVAGPIGTVAGAAIGGVAGYLLGGDDEKAPEYNPNRANFEYGLGNSGTFASTEANNSIRPAQQQLNQQAQSAQTRGAPTQGLPDRRDFVGSQGQNYLQGADAAGRQQQIAALGGLQGQTAALNQFANRQQGPSAAQAQLQAGTDAAARQQYGFARSQPGGGGAALRNAAFNAAGISGGAANQAAMLRAQEDQSFQQQRLAALGAAQQGAGMSAGYAGQLRSGDQGFAQTQAGQANYDANAQNAYNAQQQQLQFGVGQNNLNAQLQTNRGNDAFTLGSQGLAQGYQGQILQLASGQQSAGQNYEAAALQGKGLGAANFNNAQNNSRQDLAMGLGAAQGGLAAYNAMNPPAAPAGGGAQVTSDIRAKENIRPASVLSALSGGTAGEGRYGRELGREQVERAVNDVQDIRARDQFAGDTGEFNRARPAGFGVNQDRQARLLALRGGEPDPLAAAYQGGNLPDTEYPNLRPAQGFEYNYRDPERHGEGRFVGPMAQDLEHLPGVVEQGPGGEKSINAPRLTLANTAALSELQRRQDEQDRRARVAALGGGFNPAFVRPDLRAPDYAALDQAAR